MDPVDVDKAVRLVGGDAALFRELFTVIERSLPEKYARLDESLAAGLAPDLELYAHQTKGALRNVAAEGACQVLQALERCGAENRLADAPALYAEARQRIAELLAWYREGSWQAAFPD